MSNSVDSDHIAQEQSGQGLHLFVRVYLFKHLGKIVIIIIKDILDVSGYRYMSNCIFRPDPILSWRLIMN